MNTEIDEVSEKVETDSIEDYDADELNPNAVRSHEEVLEEHNKNRRRI